MIDCWVLQEQINCVHIGWTFSCPYRRPELTPPDKETHEKWKAWLICFWMRIGEKDKSWISVQAGRMGSEFRSKKEKGAERRRKIKWLHCLLLKNKRWDVLSVIFDQERMPKDICLNEKKNKVTQKSSWISSCPFCIKRPFHCPWLLTISHVLNLVVDEYILKLSKKETVWCSSKDWVVFDRLLFDAMVGLNNDSTSQINQLSVLTTCLIYCFYLIEFCTKLNTNNNQCY